MIPKPPFKSVLVGRATNNHKGREMAQLNALISIKKATGTLPVNMILVADHDEERMEIGLRKFMFDHPKLFEGADGVMGYAGNQLADGRGEIEGQSIGCVVFELETSGAKPGGLGQQPMWRHVRMLASMYGSNPNGNEVLIEGLSDDVLPPSPEETEYIRSEATITGQSFEELMSLRTRVRVNMTGMWGGNMAPGYAGSITPGVVTSKFDIRYPPNVDGEDIVRKVRAHLDKNGFSDVKLRVTGIVPWAWANADNDVARATMKMFEQFGVPYAKPPKGNYLGPRATYYGPMYLFTRGPLKLPNVRAGLGHGVGAHLGPEYYVIHGDGKKIYGYAGAIKGYATFLYNYAGLNP
jgi:acetylornithine deacetylase/succinyl-diaminopimelate desuccinylase-like protein